MKINRAYRVELDPNNVQRTALLRHAGCARWAYNWGLRRKIGCSVTSASQGGLLNAGFPLPEQAARWTGLGFASSRVHHLNNGARMNIDALIQLAPEVTLPELPELPDDPREAFRALLGFLDTGVSIDAIEEDWQARRLAVFESAYKAKYKRRKFTMSKAFHEFPEIVDHFEEEGEQIGKRFFALKSEIKDKLIELAEQVEPVPGDTWHKATTINSTSYNTQGFGANHYAKRAAESQVPSYVANGLEAEVRVDRWDDRPDYKPAFGQKRSGITDYEVWVKADPLDIEIAKRRPGMPLKDWLQWMWDHGCNPRVYDPMLPHGLERELGVSINGGWAP